MKKIFISSGLLISIIVLGFWFAQSTANRHPASLSFDNENMQILLAIPLVKDLEKQEDSELEDTTQLIDLFGQFADRNRNADDSLNRGTHAKGKCFKGSLEIFSAEELTKNFNINSDLAIRLKQGLWSYDGKLPANLRFANANGMGKIQSDKEPDVRGFSFSVLAPSSLKTYVPNGRQDFMMNSTPQFASGGIHEFLEVVKTANTLIYKDFSYFPNPLYTAAVIRDLKLIAQGNKDGGNLKSLAHINYWSNLPYTHGMRPDGHVVDVVKYKATPCDGKGKQERSDLTGLADDYLQQEILQAAEAGDICMNMQVQFMDLGALKKTASWRQKRWTATDWIENGGLLWDEADMPFYTVGRVTVEKESSSEISCEDQYINTRLHSNPENQPVGSIARVRTLVEENSRSKRMDKR